MFYLSYFLLKCSGQPDGLYHKVKLSVSSDLDFDTNDEQCEAIMRSSSTVVKRSIKKKLKGTCSKIVLLKSVHFITHFFFHLSVNLKTYNPLEHNTIMWNNVNTYTNILKSK